MYLKCHTADGVSTGTQRPTERKEHRFVSKRVRQHITRGGRAESFILRPLIDRQRQKSTTCCLCDPSVERGRESRETVELESNYDCEWLEKEKIEVVQEEKNIYGIQVNSHRDKDEFPQYFSFAHSSPPEHSAKKNTVIFLFCGLEVVPLGKSINILLFLSSTESYYHVICAGTSRFQTF